MHMPDAATQKVILIIEDDEDTLEFLDFFLGSAGYHIIPAPSGADGLARARAESIDAVLLDRRLPDKDGVEICRQLRQHLDTQVPIIMMTADRGKELEATAQAAGATDFLRKPFLPDQLLKCLTAHLQA
jgi:DNA-binding response OmpR family regulator